MPTIASNVQEPAVLAGTRAFEAVWNELERRHAWKISELEVDNKPVAVSRFPFVWQDYDNRRAVAFREKHRLAEVIAGASNDWEAILRLRHWTYTHMRDGTPSFVPPNPAALVDASLSGATFWCTFFAYAFVAACGSMGIPARHLGIDCEHTADEGSTHHGISDVWSNHLRKWVAVDAHHDSHHEVDGVPLNAEEVGQHWRSHRGVGMKSLIGPTSREVPRARACVPSKHESCGYFWHYIDCEVDLLHQRNQPWPNPVILLVDEERKRQTWYQGPKGKSYKHGRYSDGSFLTTEKFGDAYPDLNCARLSLLEPTKPYSCRVQFGGGVPNFQHYVAIIDGESEVRIDGVEYPWRLHPGVNAIEVRAVNTAGVRGPASRIRIRIEDDPKRKPEWPSVPS
jgi:hypothetical protein